MIEILSLQVRIPVPWADIPAFLIRGRTPIIGVRQDEHPVAWFEPLGAAELMSYTWLPRLMPEEGITPTRNLVVEEVVEHQDLPDPRFGCRACGERGQAHTATCLFQRSIVRGHPALPWVCCACGRLHRIPAWYAPGAVRLTHPCPCNEHFQLEPLWGAPALRVLLLLKVMNVPAELGLGRALELHRRDLRLFGLVAPVALRPADEARIELLRSR